MMCSGRYPFLFLWIHILTPRGTLTFSKTVVYAKRQASGRHHYCYLTFLCQYQLMTYFQRTQLFIGVSDQC